VTRVAAADRLLIAKIGAAHGVRGEVKLIAFGDDPAALLDYGALSAADGRRFTITGLHDVAGRLVARIDGVRDRNAAEAIAGTELFIERDRLPPTEDEDTFYHVDLIGLAALTPAGEPLGRVVGVPNYGAGDLLEIAPAGEAAGTTLLVPFTRAVVPVIDVAGGRVVVDPPAGLLPEPGRDAAEGAERDAAEQEAAERDTAEEDPSDGAAIANDAAARDLPDDGPDGARSGPAATTVSADRGRGRP
jgi:16S rRNA processing protein RimM